ncbi:electron transfer flavoprotein subunit beta/FixA family protein [Neobacillus mesonae]|uniref:electron transfer flavoprotein subunit beta/FixA family protein n=1 Tax=Neobacillus mesonae TaxID=1193713 RepID=UPI00203CA9FD|nr:electron transfer flavoprotein subunit beta/FixA family protein [Neobacillus mesonae]MCM3568081.1 electron transfer flavoprotein subunit beta/FixA family protein [Neobacillus mesonae]
MNIFVLMKRTFDTEEKILINNGKIEESGAEFIINPYDEYAIEEAIILREQHGGEVTVVTVGEEETEKELRTALAMGVDKAVLIKSDELDVIDQFTVSMILAAYLKNQEYDMIIGGNVTVDGGSGQVGPSVAEILDIPQVTTITNLEINDMKATIVRDVEGNEEIVEVSLPVLVTAQQGLNEPRYPSLPGIMKAKKKPLVKLELDDLNLDVDDIEAKSETVEVFLPSAKQAGKVLEGENQTQVKELISLLISEAKVI